MKLTVGRHEEPQKSYDFEFEFLSVFALGQNLKYRAKQVVVPMNSVDTVKRYFGSARYSVPTRSISPNTLTVTFYDVQGLNTWRYFRSWYETVSSEKFSFQANPDRYMRAAAMKACGDGTISDSFIVFSELYPIEVGDLTFNSSDSSEVVFDVRFYYGGMGVV